MKGKPNASDAGIFAFLEEIELPCKDNHQQGGTTLVVSTERVPSCGCAASVDSPSPVSALSLGRTEWQ